MEILNDSNFLLYAAKHYDNPSCYDTTEFYEDLNKFKYLKRLFSRYDETNELRERLILNHIIVIYNLFGVEASTKMLFFKLKGYHHYLKPFLVFLNYCPDILYGVEENVLHVNDILMDPEIIKALRKIWPS